MLFTVVVSKEDNWYIAKCVENSVASQGKTIEEAIANLKEALELYAAVRILVELYYDVTVRILVALPY